MSEVKRYSYGFHDDGFGEGRHLGLIEKPDGALVPYDDYARLERECKDAKCLSELFQRAAEALREERDAALKQAACLRELLTRCQEHLDPHRDAALWSDVCAALGPMP